MSQTSEIETLRADRDRLAARVVELERERDAIMQLCFAPGETPGGNWYYRLLIDQDEREGGRYWTLGAAIAAVRRAAGLDTPDPPPASPSLNA